MSHISIQAHLGISPRFCVLWNHQNIVTSFSKSFNANPKTVKNLWNVYDLIQQQFLAIHGFFGRVHINLEAGDIPEGLHFILVKILITMLTICGIATKYAKKNSFKRST